MSRLTLSLVADLKPNRALSYVAMMFVQLKVFVNRQAVTAVKTQTVEGTLTLLFFQTPKPLSSRFLIIHC